LSPSGTDRLIAPDRMRGPNPDCPVCSVAQTRSRATLNDLVEDFLRLELGYGEEFVVNNEQGLLYDVEETDNLEKKLSELGMIGFRGVVNILDTNIIQALKTTPS
jgi:ubiquitin-like 1-activating enzyme E1 B